jgi:hypothetical protein
VLERARSRLNGRENRIEETIVSQDTYLSDGAVLDPGKATF